MIQKLLLILFPLLLFGAKPHLLLLGVYKDQNVTNWVMSEKLDGVRAYWDGKHLVSRGGKIIHAPAWFTKGYPKFPIDGELWSKRKDFENISSIVRDKNPSKKWHEIKHYIYEVPFAKGGLLQRLKKVRPYENSVIIVLKQIKVKDKKALEVFLKSVEKKGGEGVVVRDPYAPYIAKRTNKALKVKSFLDTECRVLAYKEGKGKYKGLMGSLKCQLTDGTLFFIGSGFTIKERKNPPPLGSEITFKYKEMTKYHKPRFPIFLRVRE